MSFPRLISIHEWKSTHQEDDKKAQAVTQRLNDVYAATTIYHRFDYLIELYDHCVKNEYPDLQRNVMDIFKYLLDDDNERQIEKKLKQRKRVREFDPCYMPWHRPQLSNDIHNDPHQIYQEVMEETTSEYLIEKNLTDAFKQFYAAIKENDLTLKEIDLYSQRNDIKDNVKRFTKKELEAYRVIPSHGKLISLVNDGKGDNRHLTFTPLQTASLSIQSLDEETQTPSDIKDHGIYVIDIDGSMFVGPSIHPERINGLEATLLGKQPILHPSYCRYLNGVKPFMAGQIGGVVDGVVHEIDAASGHFKPDHTQNSLAMRFLKKIGIVHNNTRQQFFHPVHQKFMHFRAAKTEYKAFRYHTLHGKSIMDEKNEFRHQYLAQTIINQEYARWMKESSVSLFNNPSAHTLRINKTVQAYSNNAKIKNAADTVELLDNALLAIEDWHRYHQENSLNSRRTPAVNALEERLLQQKLYFMLRDVCGQSGSTHPLINAFMDFKIGKDELYEACRSFDMEYLIEHEETRLLNLIRTLDLNQPKCAVEQLDGYRKELSDYRYEK